ncbi:SPOR domain-containing protein [Thalassotalea piscium]
MSALAQLDPLTISKNNESVTSISVNARIDYILRFSKHSILVVDESAEACSSVGYQFLDQISSDHNAAFVSASVKLNNIQIRCRIIEQLFSDSVFDPEQSLAVTIINLLNADPQKLAIVIDNVHCASLQIIHELTQLTLIAKKAKLEIEVLMLGNYTAGRMLAQHKDLFHKKISILSKQSGQLLSLNAKEFKTSGSWFTLTVSKKWLIALLTVTLISILTVIWLRQQGPSNFAKLPEKTVEQLPLNSTADETVLPRFSTTTDETASTNDIYTALTVSKPVQETIVHKDANVNDIVMAIAAFEAPLTQNNESSASLLPDEVLNTAKVSSTIETTPKAAMITETKVVALGNHQQSNKSEPVDPSPSSIALTKEIQPTMEFSGSQYYKSFTKGFVIQLSGFTQESIMKEFLADFTSLTFKHYKRLLNGEVMTVLTSKHYATHAEAEQALNTLPESILTRNPWIKTISAINNEINAFERSQ